MNFYEKLLVEFFGITDSIAEAGYILKDGRLIDLSGRHFIEDPIERKHYIGGNIIQHHDIFGENYCGFSIEDIWPDIYSENFLPVKEILEKTQSISLKFDRSNSLACWIRMMFPPTEEQYRVILKYFEEAKAYISYISTDGYIVEDTYIAFLTEKKLKSFVEKCANKKPTNILFDGAVTLAKDIVCSPIRKNYLPMIDLQKYKGFRIREKSYQDPNNTRHQKDFKR